MARSVSQTYGAPNLALFEGSVSGYVHFTPTQVLVDNGAVLPKVTTTVAIEANEESDPDYLASFEVELTTTDEYGGGWAYVVREELWRYGTDGEVEQKILDRESVIEIPPGLATTLAALIEAEEESS